MLMTDLKSEGQFEGLMWLNYAMLSKPGSGSYDGGGGIWDDRGEEAC